MVGHEMGSQDKYPLSTVTHVAPTAGRTAAFIHTHGRPTNLAFTALRRDQIQRLKPLTQNCPAVRFEPVRQNARVHAAKISSEFQIAHLQMLFRQ